MKIWLNDKRVVRDSRYTYCVDCCLNYILPDRSRAICLAARFKLRSTSELCFKGYKYEADV